MKNTTPLTPDFDAARDEVLVRPLEAADWKAFKAWTSYAHKSHGGSDEAYKIVAAQPASFWQAELSYEQRKFFAAFDQGKIIALGNARNVDAFHNAFEVLLEVAGDRQGAGIGTKLYSAMKDYIAQEHPGMDMLARILPQNMASRRSAEKAGLTYTGRTERPIPPSDSGYMHYGITAHKLSLGLQATTPVNAFKI